jgi:hypothetical protein
MKMRGLAVCALVGIMIGVLGAGTANSAASEKVWYNPDLGVYSRAQLAKRLAAPFPEGEAHPDGVSNCLQLLKGNSDAKTGSPDRLSAEMRSTMAECMVLQQLHRARPARVSYGKDLAWDANLLSLLPPQMAIAVSAESKSAAEAAAAKGESWAQFDLSASAAAGTKGPNEIVVTGNGFSERLILWGRGDFTGDGKDDLLVESLDTLTEGSYRNVRLFVLRRGDANEGLKVVRELL